MKTGSNSCSARRQALLLSSVVQKEIECQIIYRMFYLFKEKTIHT